MKFFEDNFPDWLSGVNFKKNVTIGTSGTNASLTINGVLTSTGANGSQNAPVNKATPVAVNATATLTAAQVATGYITSTSAAAVTMTMPTGTLLGAALGAAQGTEFELVIDNTAGANTVTMAVAVNGILSSLAVASGALDANGNFGMLTIPSGVTGQGQFTLMFSSPTAYTFSRTA